jgi:AraC-like DNA-binding protein
MTELLYSEEHLSCYHYDNNENPTIRTLDFKKGQKKSIQINSHSIFIIQSGSGNVSFGEYVNQPIKGGDIILFPLDAQAQFDVKDKISAIVYKLAPGFHFCDHFSLESLYHQGYKPATKHLQILKVNERIKMYLDALIPCLGDGLRCIYFLELKTKELFFLLRAYNTKDMLAAFFSPILTEDMDFYNFVLDNYQSIKTVKELALLADYSLTGFEKRFKRIFGMSAHQWMKNQLSSKLYHDISCGRKTFTELTTIYGFSSSAHLSNYCKVVFGKTPSTIRKSMTIIK